MENNVYLNLLRKSKTRDVEIKKHEKKEMLRDVQIKKSPRREIIEHQKGRCYMCEKHLGNEICNFAEIEGPDMKTEIVSKELRAICQLCYFNLGKNPVKAEKKKSNKQRQVEEEKESD